MTHPDTDEGVRGMFSRLPEIARVEQLDPGVWLVIFADGAQATAFPLEGRFVDDPLNEQRRVVAERVGKTL